MNVDPNSPYMLTWYGVGGWYIVRHNGHGLRIPSDPLAIGPFGDNEAEASFKMELLRIAWEAARVKP